MFKGVGTAIITPFDKDKKVDFKALEKFVEFQAKYVDAIIVLGTTGEAPTISEYEREKIVNKVVEVVDKKIPVIVGTGSNNPEHVITNNMLAKKSGADGLLIVNPYYNKSTQNGLVEYYTYIAERTDLPIILYNVPSRTGSNILPETAVKIFEKNENVIGIKEASGNISQIAELISVKPEDMKVYSGNDDQALPLMALGGDGVISVFSNVLPEVMKKLTHAIIKNDYKTAQEINKKYNVLMRKLFIEVNPIPIKYAVSKLGYCKNILRLPLVELSENSKKIIDNLFKELGI
ncbi:4-hydroxy-tetrahydrodipicolinate synthase [Marinitoga sp. 1135]|uniref:4-hydroxy-tetrahydrodipicolinate synthase n=1 Tax=unclassified Marinitoga TaxID=2640159 RepID=UPI00095095B5|nr:MULTISPECIES: 4-hydroxy-tetrahydrodipicolinate synthase [unclassified Marinitoga]APT75537.1 4-hydroxy-tetrahydrodipicolinate synthase [Marinitoga sp. 1137]NUU95248.1 4-hydroxy-tetrahydrodipicolinate synthase [Marinitoga sp. 1135]NUU97181.1 4-hydroxy-tetrahydrodipicolinate synthase [Marinitoga sp. 1138]